VRIGCFRGQLSKVNLIYRLGMELSELEIIKDIYGWVCVGLFLFWAFQLFLLLLPYEGMQQPSRTPTTQRLLAMGIVGWSGYISLTSNVESIDFLNDWLITVPLIFLSLSYKGMSEGWRYNTLLLGFVSIAAILLAGDVSEGEGQLSGLDLNYELILAFTAFLWLVLWIRVTGLSFVESTEPMTHSYRLAFGSGDYSELSMYEKVTFLLLLAYPILFFLAGSTVNDMTAYKGSMLDEWGLHFYSYVTLLILLSCICKIGLSIYHVMTDEEA